MAITHTDAATQESATFKEQSCPHCQAILPVYEGFPTWCDRCGWNLEVPEPSPFESLLDHLYRSIGRASSQHLFEQMCQAEAFVRTWSLSRLLAFILAGCVHAITLAFIVLGIWLSLLAWPSLMGLILGAPCFILAWVLLPRLPRTDAVLLSREQFPNLFKITDRVTQALGSPPVDGIAMDIFFNASFGRYGWRRRLLTLGLPLFSILDEREKVALLGHELGHGVNSDPTRGLIIGTALYTLATWYHILYPRSYWYAGIGPFGLVILLLRLLGWLLANLVWLWAYLLTHLLWRDQQRAEYRADYLAATVSGTAAHLAMLEKIQLDETFRHCLKISYLNRTGQNFFQKLRTLIVGVPARELERIRRIEQQVYARLDVTHPPTAYRIAFLKAHEVPAAKVILTPEEAAALEQELAFMQEEMQRRVFGLDEQSFRAIYRLSW